MKKVIVALSLLTAMVVYGAVELFRQIPTATGTAVIATKDDSNQVAVLLPANLTAEQSKLLNTAYKIAKDDGHKDPELVQSILLQETKAGGMKTFRVANAGPDAYFGPMQVKLSAARDVLLHFPALFTKYALQTHTDDEIKAHLIIDDSFNIEIASKYLLLLQREYGYSGRELLNAYNRGPAGVKAVVNDYHYARGAEAKLAALKNGRRF